MITDPMLDAARALEKAGRVLLACHVNPDGDTMGSALALGLALEAAGKQVTMVSPDEVPHPYRFMPASERFLHAVPDEPFDLSVALDCDGEHRLGPMAAGVRRAPCVLELDHHPGTERFGNIVVVEPTAAATGEIVFELLRMLGVAPTPDVATNLYVAIMTDTGSFRYANTTPRAMRVCAELVDCGAQPAFIAQQVYETRPFPAMAILGRALASIQRTADGAIAWAHITSEDFCASQGTDADTEGVVNHLLGIAGVRAAALFREIDGRVRVSLRARAPVDVAQVARAFAGGGHRLAAGCTVEAPLPQAEQQVLNELLQAVSIQ